MKILGIDPGPTKSAWVWFEEGRVITKGIYQNPEMEKYVGVWNYGLDTRVAIEFVQCYGMAVGREVFETIYWSGRFANAAGRAGARVERYGRPTIKSWITGMGRANDSNVRQALMMRYGGAKKGEPLAGVVKDIWSALAVAVYVHEASKTGELKEW